MATQQITIKNHTTLTADLMDYTVVITGQLKPRDLVMALKAPQAEASIPRNTNDILAEITKRVNAQKSYATLQLLLKLQQSAHVSPPIRPTQF